MVTSAMTEPAFSTTAMWAAVYFKSTVQSVVKTEDVTLAVTAVLSLGVSFLKSKAANLKFMMTLGSGGGVVAGLAAALVVVVVVVLFAFGAALIQYWRLSGPASP